MTNSSNKQEILVYGFLIVLIVGAVIFIHQYRSRINAKGNTNTQQKNEDISRILLYHNDNYTYKITQKNDYISIKKESDLDCDVVDCEKLDSETTEITNKEIKKETIKLLNELFEDYKGNKLDITMEDLTIDQLTSMDYILESLIEDEMTYDILKEPYKEVIKQRGYITKEQEDGEFLVVIAMGEKKTGGYSININKIAIEGENATIYVTETSPDKNVATTQALTYPTAQATFSRKPEKIRIINEQTGNSFNEIKVQTNNIKYTILESSHNNSYYRKKGYYIKDNKITIASGEKETSGYKIIINKVDITNDNVTIYIEETEHKGIVDNNKTFPIAEIEFNELPKEIKVVNIKTKEEIKEIKEEQ